MTRKHSVRVPPNKAKFQFCGIAGQTPRPITLLYIILGHCFMAQIICTLLYFISITSFRGVRGF